MNTRTRFAPSPTGYLHVGSVRTALYCYLYARKQQGAFILRIEDTDQARSTQASVQTILDGMQWLGLHYDEGPFYQMQRLERYREAVEALTQSGHAYRCTCTKERLANLREQQLKQKQKPRYDGCCRHKSFPANEDQPYVVRFCNPEHGQVSFRDEVHGIITVNNEELDDFVIVRSDGIPTYNFSVVIDDIDMCMTHVIRGDDHINNTPRQINIYHALGVTPPIYAHIPMILGDDGKRLSKRHGAVSVMQYRELGYLPQALLNYLVRLGWSHGDQEIFSCEDMINLFDLQAVNKAAASFDTEKLQWLNQHYIKTLDIKEILPEFQYQLQQLDVSCEDSEYLAKIINAQRTRCKTLQEMAQKSIYFFKPVDTYDDKAVKKNFKGDALTVLQLLLTKLTEVSAWLGEPLHDIILQTAASLDVKLGQVAQPLRVALTGNTVSPPMDITLEIMGRDQVLERLQKAITYIESLPQVTQ